MITFLNSALNLKIFSPSQPIGILILILGLIFMNMDVSNEELHELLTKFMKRLDKMEKERDVMKKKLDRLSKHVSDVNNVDTVYLM